MDIAIIGAACRMPGANNLDAFAELLFGERDAVSEIPEGRWSKARFFDPTPGQPGKTYSFAAGCLDQVGAFDAAFFGISPREAVSIDPQQRLMLELAYEAIEDGGLTLSGLAGSATGVFVGGSSWDFAARSFDDTAALDAYAMQGAALSSLSNRVSYLFGLRGPSFSVDTACSSSLVALHLACESIRRGESGLALAGGVNLLLAPQSFVGFARASMLSRRGRCHPFDARADGYVRAEGGGAVLLKPLAQALADGDAIRAVIRASGVNSDGRTNGFSLPSGEAQAALLRDVYARAGVEPDDLAYFEAHGTGTPVGDPIEAHAIGTALARRRAAPLPIGSVKSNVGHLEPASGMAGLMKLILAFAHGAVPRSLNFETPNPNIPFTDLNLAVVEAPLALVPGLLAGINSFGFGGTNAHAILAAPPLQPIADEAGIAAPLLLSARSSEALRALASDWRDLLAAGAATPAMRRGAARLREQHAQRMAVLADSDAGMAEHLDAWLAEGRDPGVATGQAVSGGLAFVFSGNGSQWAGMGRDALARSPAFRAALEHIDLHLAGALGWSVTEMLGDAGLDRALRNTTVAQPLLFAVQVASVVALRAQGVQPIACVGHSAGEVAAAWACGALSLDQACHVIVQRSHAQQPTHGIGRMAALGLGADEAAKLIVELRLDVAIAAINGAAAVTIAGADASLAELEDEAIARGLPFTALDLDYAFHSPAMEPIRTPLLAALDGLRPGTPTFPMHSTVTGQPVGPGELDASYWWRNVRQPVLFRDAVAGLIEAGARIFLEVGPQPVLQSFLRDALKRAGHVGQVLRSLSREPASVDPFAAIAASCHVAGAGLDRATLFDGPATPRGLPAYPWQRQKYAAPRTVEAVELVNLMREHPLLGFRDPASNAVWLSHLSTTLEPWLADHAVDGTAVLPAAAMIDMALAAARAHHPDAGSLEIQDLEISRSLVLDPGATRECRVSVAADGQLELASRPRLADEAMVTHATGRILAGLGDQPTLPLLVGGGEGMDAQTVYAAAAAMHLQYGPQFRRVARVRRIDATHGVVELAPPLLDRVALGYLIDPTLLDGCLQGLLALAAHRPERNQGVVVPWRFGRIRLLRPHGACPTEACLTVRHVGPRAICADIALSDETGAVVAELLDCWFVAMPAGGAALADQSFWTAYVPSARQVAPASADLLGRVLAGAAGVANLPATVLLADAYLAAAAFEARPVRGPLATLAMDWLEEDGLAVREADGWRLAAQSDLPEAAEIWRSLLFDVPRAGAECALLAAIPPALADAALADPAPADSDMGLALSATLREQVLFASPSAASAISALVQGVADLASHWAPGRCMRVALVGAAHAKLLQAVADRLAGCRIPARFVVFTDEADGLAALRDRVAHLPGASIASRGALDAEQPDRFDLVLDLYGLSLPGRAGLTPAMLAGLLAPGGLLLAAEPAASRFAALLFGPALQGDAALRAPDAWCAALREAGCTAAEPVPLDGALWPVALLAATQAANLPATLPAEPGDLVVFAAPDDPLVAALSARQGMLRLLPIEAMADALAAPFAGTLRHLLLFAPGTGDDEAGAETLPEMLAEVSGALLRLPALAAARLWLVARGSPADSTVPAGLTGLRRVAANEVPGLECRTLCLDAALPPAEAAERILSELTDPDGEREAWWHAGGRLVPRLQRGLPPAPLDSGPRVLDVARPGLIGSLVWRPATRRPPGPGEIAIAVRAAALNFRDVMWAQGLLPDEALIDGFSGPSLGLECAGVVTAVGQGVDDIVPGDRVIAVAPAALATHVVTARNGVMRLPGDLDFAAGATVPVAFMTAVYALGHLARLQPGERVLIHGGAGGVGLAAIQFALHRGAIVYATAGSPMRRQMLRLLGVVGVFDSRGTGFVDDLLRATNAEGVDVVLNSLSGELMQQSLRLLRPFGRFLEIGKRDLYRNTPIGIRSLRHNAAYFAIDTDELVARRPAIGQAVLDEVAELLAAGRLRPLPYRAYGFAAAVDAFRLLQSSGHVGKVVLLPEPTPMAHEPPAFSARPDGVYLVTGGLSGFGLEAARWLARNGARRLALLSRRGERSPDAAAILAAFAADGVRAEAFACDVADEAQLQRTLTRVRALGELRGVLHAAMVLDDAPLAALDAARFAAVIRPKLSGAVALDRLTRDDRLDLFVLFSSVTTVIGTPGQAAYVAANAALEALAERRHAAGLPALAVQWGPIGDAGYLARETRVGDMLAKMLGASPLRAAQALDRLPALLASGRAVIGVADVAWGDLRARLPGLAAPFWSEMPASARQEGSGESLRARLADLSADDATEVILDVLREELAGILKQSPAAIDANRPILEFGVDSLMAVELRTALEARLDVQLPLLALTSATTLRAMAARLLAAMQGGGEPARDDVAAAILRHEGAEAAPQPVASK